MKPVIYRAYTFFRCLFYGYNLKEFLTKSWMDCYSPETVERLNNEAITHLHIYGKWKGEAKGIRKDGSIFPQELLISNIEGSKKRSGILRIFFLAIIEPRSICVAFYIPLTFLQLNQTVEQYCSWR